MLRFLITAARSSKNTLSPLSVSQPLAAEKGQALFEFILFIPIFISIYSIAMNYFGAVNGSINQQKITRGYLYSRLTGNSHAPTPQVLQAIDNGVQNVGMFMLGWRERFVNGQSPLAPCYNIRSIGGSGDFDNCEDRYNAEETSHVRVRTAYGVCTATVRRDGLRFVYSDLSANFTSCTLN